MSTASPASFAHLVSSLGTWLAHAHAHGARVIGINGAQGSGKSTLATALIAELAARHALHAAVLALDDMYLPRAQRLALARTVHPLLATRGVPGTHEVALGAHLLQQLVQLGHGARCPVPRFLKLDDDRAPRAQWHVVTGPVDLVLFEGWCVATPPQSNSELVTPVNTLEAQEDRDGRWRRWVNGQLAHPYAKLFARLDRLLFLAAPDFNCVLRWRLEQEATTAKREHGVAMTRAAVQRFIAHYERLTRHAFACLPKRANVVVRLDRQRACHALELRGDEKPV
ncbi:MAG TPA: hypothetical protein VFQ88_05065 [Nevskiaceae bacterium]|nr:hypothetical protein [Nevskiaceae bacterium]